VKIKALALILLTIFASAAAMSFAFGISNNQRSQQKIGFAQPYNIVEIGNETLVEPNGDPIDCPGGPTQI